MGSLTKKVRQALRLDGWQNILTGLGRSSLDKRLGATAIYELMQELEIENLYAADEMAQKIVNKLPEDMMREGFHLASSDADDSALNEAIDIYKGLTVTDNSNKYLDGLQWGRLYGGAVLVIGARDNVIDLTKPLDARRIQEIEYLTLLNRFELHPRLINVDARSKNFGLPETYLITPRMTTNGFQSNDLAGAEIHASRLIRFDGIKLPRQMFIRNYYWHDSILNALRDDIRDFQGSYESASALMVDFSQAVYKIKGLADIVSAPDGLNVLQRRIQALEMARSVLRASLIDADGEDFERKSTSLAGLPDTLDRLSRRFTASTEYPHTILLGDSPSGLGATGESEKKTYYDLVRSRQLMVLKPRLRSLFDIIFTMPSGPTRGVLPNYDIDFEPIEHLTRKEELEARANQAKADEIYLNTGVLDPSEVAASRFGSGAYSYQTEIDLELRDLGSFQPLAVPPSIPTRTDAFMETHIHTTETGLTGEPINAGLNSKGQELHYHMTEYGPTEPNADTEAHIHMIKTPSEVLETGPSFIYQKRVADNPPGDRGQMRGRSKSTSQIRVP